MKNFLDIKILYKKSFRISKYYPISNSNINTVITNMNYILNQVQILIVVTKFIILIMTTETVLLIIVVLVIVNIGILILVIVKIIVSLLLM